jgi:hypothetical protein
MDQLDQLRQAQEQVAQLRSLVNHPGWVWLANVGKAQIENRLTDIVLTAPAGMDDLIAKNFSTGEMAGAKLLLAIPEIRIAELQEAIELLLKEIGETGDDDRDERDDYPIG